MSELRWDPLKQHWVIIATERGRRPRDFEAEPEPSLLTNCPFCYGNEDKTPPEIYALREGGAPNSPNWRVRVIPNKYPALGIEGDVKTKGYGPYDRMNGIGAHEVIIETPDHERGLADLTVEELAEVVGTYRARFLDLRNDPRLRYMVLYKNHGARAGAGLSHSYSQLIAVPLTPPVAATEMKICREFYAAKERCFYCDIIDFEIAEGARVVKEFPNFVSVTPFASCFPFELRLYPRRHCHDFALTPDGELLELAQALKDMLSRLKSVLRDPPYNFILHTAPHAAPAGEAAVLGLAGVRLPLAYRAGAAAHPHRRVRVGDRVLHQPHFPRRRRRFFEGGGGVEPLPPQAARSDGLTCQHHL